MFKSYLKVYSHISKLFVTKLHESLNVHLRMKNLRVFQKYIKKIKENDIFNGISYRIINFSMYQNNKLFDIVIHAVSILFSILLQKHFESAIQLQ